MNSPHDMFLTSLIAKSLKDLNIQTGEKILTDFGSILKKKRKTISLSDEKLQNLAKNVFIEK